MFKTFRAKGQCPNFPARYYIEYTGHYRTTQKAIDGESKGTITLLKSATDTAHTPFKKMENAAAIHRKEMPAKHFQARRDQQGRSRLSIGYKPPESQLFSRPRTLPTFALKVMQTVEVVSKDPEPWTNY